MKGKGFGNFNKHFNNMGNAGLQNPRSIAIALLLGGLLYLGSSCVYYVDIGHYAIKFNRLFGLSAHRYREGYNLKIPII
jgi:hypothetical protein